MLLRRVHAIVTRNLAGAQRKCRGFQVRRSPETARNLGQDELRITSRTIAESSCKRRWMNVMQGWLAHLSLSIPTDRPLVICPLEFERKSLVRAGLGRWSELACCGPGVCGVGRIVEHLTATNAMGSRVIILAGLAGAFDDTLDVSGACIARVVVDAQTGERFEPTMQLVQSGQDDLKLPRVAITSSEHTLTTRDAKIRMRDRTGAQLVDLESVAFARAATAAGWSWCIVRGISDSLSDELPAGIDQWVRLDGSTNIPAMINSAVHHPRQIPAIIRLAGRSALAMRAVATALRAALIHGEQ
jgi:adenosylhomocysteine nucleosidase